MKKNKELGRSKLGRFEKGGKCNDILKIEQNMWKPRTDCVFQENREDQAKKESQNPNRWVPVTKKKKHE